MRCVLGAPAVDEKAGGHEQGGREHEGDAEFGAALVSVARFEGAVDPVGEWGAELGAEEESDAETDVVQAAYADAFVVAGGGPEGGEGGQNEIHEAVEVGHVDG